MSGAWGTSHYRRKVALQLGISVERLDRALKEFERREDAGDDYRSPSHNDRLKAFAAVLDIPLTKVAGVDGVSSLLPDRKARPKKRSSRPPKKETAGGVRSSGKRPARKAKSATKTVPMKKFPWELDPPPRRPEPRAEPQQARRECQACGQPLNPLTGACGCT